MKKLIALTFFFISISSLIFSQEKKTSISLISGTWKIESVQIQDEIINVTNEDNWISFSDKGFYEIYLNNSIETGVWKLQPDNKLKFDFVSSEDELSVIGELTTDELKLSISEYTLILKKEKNVQSLTLGKWKINTVSFENEVINVEQEDNWMAFHTNGFYEIYLDKEKQSGTWRLNDNNELKIDEEGFDGESHLSELTQEELNFSVSGYAIALSK